MSTATEVSAYVADIAAYISQRGQDMLGYPCVFALVTMPIIDGEQRFSVVGNIHDSMLMDILRRAVFDYDQAVAAGKVDAAAIEGPMQ